MKVLYITNLPSPYKVKFFSELGKFCELTVIYERRSASDRNTKWTEKGEETFKEIYLNAHEVGTDNSWSFKVLKYLNRSYDCIVIGMYSTITSMISITYMKTKKIPFILSTDGGFIKEEGKGKETFKKFFISAADNWLSTGKVTSEYLCHYGADLKRTAVYPFTSLTEKDILLKPVNIEEKRKLRNKLGIKEEKVLISVGQFIYRKGFDILLEACKSVDNKVGVYIIGGQASKEYRDLCERYKITNVHFIDFMEKQELLEYYKASDLFVLPTREDVWGLVINEAMACGLPIITTDRCIAGIELIENEKNGYIVPTDDPKALNEKIVRILSDKKLKENMSNRSLEKIKDYTFLNMAETHIKIFQGIFSNRYS
ncbi:glycosyltransferase family 4 protein [Priestia megaterium]